MFSCGTSSTPLGTMFESCGPGPLKIKKIGDYMYHYDYLIGKGTYSKVYQGLNIRTDKPVAIKVIDLELFRSKNIYSLLYQQTEMLSQLDHPNVIKCYSMMKSQNRCYIVTELCKKETLQQLMEKSPGRRLSTQQSEKVIFDIFQGLQYLAQRTIIHRDLKSANILFSHSGRAKIADFGFSTHGLNEFKDNVLVGTPLYMSPEAVLEQKYSAKTDIWSFGILVYELTFGQAPLSTCKNENQFLAKIVQPVNIPSTSKADPDLLHMLEGCLEINSVNRWSIDKLSNCRYMRKLKQKFMSRLVQSNQSSRLFGMDSVSTHSKNHQQGEQLHKLHKVSSKSSLNGNLEFKIPIGKKQDAKFVGNTQKIKVGIKSQSEQSSFVFSRKSELPIKKQKIRTLYSQTGSAYEKTHDYSPMTIKQSKMRVQQQAPSNRLSLTSQFKYRTTLPQQHFQLKQVGLNPAKQVQRLKTINQYNYSSQGEQDKPLPRTIMRKAETFPQQRMTDMLPRPNTSLRSPQPDTTPGPSLIRGRVMQYKDIVHLIHYCRLLHKVLQFPKYHHDYLKNWLIFFIGDLRANAQVNSIKEQHVKSLKNALQNYYKQYAEAHEQVKTAPTKNFFPQFKAIVKILQSLREHDIATKQKSNYKQLLNWLFQQTKLLQSCMQGNSLQKYSSQSKCEMYLDWFNRDSKS